MFYTMIMTGSDAVMQMFQGGNGGVNMKRLERINGEMGYG